MKKSRQAGKHNLGVTFHVLPKNFLSVRSHRLMCAIRNTTSLFTKKPRRLYRGINQRLVVHVRCHVEVKWGCHVLMLEHVLVNNYYMSVLIDRWVIYYIYNQQRVVLLLVMLLGRCYCRLISQQC